MNLISKYNHIKLCFTVYSQQGLVEHFLVGMNQPFVPLLISP